MMERAPDILIFSDNEKTLKTPETILALNNYFVHIAPKDESGFKILTQHKFDLIIIEMSQHFTFEMNFIEKIHTLNNYAPIVIMPDLPYETRAAIFGTKIPDYLLNPSKTQKLYTTIKDTILTPKSEAEKITSSLLMMHLGNY